MKQSSLLFSTSFHKGLTLFFLLIAIGVGAWLRIYHLDYPSIGYHNMKENEYLGILMNYWQEGLSWERKVYFYAGHLENPIYNWYPQVPLLSYVGYFLWSLFGESLWIIRLHIVLFSLGTIVLTYLLIEKMTKDRTLAILNASLMAVLPVNVFFGRNIQPETPALFFLLLFFWLFYRWKEKPTFKFSLCIGIVWCIAGFYKSPYIVPTVAIVAFFPWKDLFQSLTSEQRWHRLKPYYGFLSILILLVYLFQITKYKTNYTSVLYQTNDVFDPSYWQRLYNIGYFPDNYTFFLSGLGIFGLSFLWFQRERLFWLVYLLSLGVYFLVFSYLLVNHSYYQMPYLPLVVFCISIAIYYPLYTLGKWIGFPLRFLVFFIFVFSWGDIQQSINRQFDTQFFGIDFAGEYIREFSKPEERFMQSTLGQHIGICHYAQRFCTSFRHSEKDFREYENQFGSRFLYLQAESLPEVMKSESWSYVKQTYGVVQIGLFQQGEKLYPKHFVMQKGVGYSWENIQKQPNFRNKQREYELTHGKLPFLLLEYPK